MSYPRSFLRSKWNNINSARENSAGKREVRGWALVDLIQTRGGLIRDRNWHVAAELPAICDRGEMAKNGREIRGKSKNFRKRSTQGKVYVTPGALLTIEEVTEIDLHLDL